MRKWYAGVFLVVACVVCARISWRYSYAMEGEIDVGAEGRESGEVDVQDKDTGNVPPEIIQQQQEQAGQSEAVDPLPPLIVPAGQGGEDQVAQGDTQGFSSEDTKVSNDTDESGDESQEAEETVAQEVAEFEEADDYSQSRQWPDGQSPFELKLQAFKNQIDERDRAGYNEQQAQLVAQKIVPDLQTADAQEAQLELWLKAALDQKNKTLFDRAVAEYGKFTHAEATLMSRDAVTTEIKILQQLLSDGFFE